MRSSPRLGGSAAGSAARAAGPGDSPQTAVSIFTLTSYAKSALEGAIPELWVHGEISSTKKHRSGHVRFILKDRLASLDCVVWASDDHRVGTRPTDGLSVVVRGKLSIYDKSGRTQFVVRRIEMVGEGAAERLKKETIERLKRDGLLAPERKRKLPYLARRIAIITSLDGAAMHDVVSVARARSPLVELVVVNARVQGDEAVSALLEAFERVGRWKDADVVILARGGGAAEDLRAFNDERVARAVAACPVPVISAVGHETDITVCDLVADVRAATPSAAAERAVRPLDDLREMMRRAGQRLHRGAARSFAAGRQRLAKTAMRIADRSERSLVRRRRQMERLHGVLAARGPRLTEPARALLEGFAGRLDGLSPLKTLARGYGLAVDEKGAALTSARRFAPGERFTLLLHDGRVHAETKSADDQRPATAGRTRKASTPPGPPEP